MAKAKTAMNRKPNFKAIFIFIAVPFMGRKITIHKVALAKMNHVLLKAIPGIINVLKKTVEGIYIIG
ncbi:hypothetical protein [Mucilaginibacter dorajii]|uniref:hypothetical protein n=1 Tax=Mucilaginibacter dorajii TaxID=692994 RepID=UPI002168AD92|nr:hypothetical protein [Mucilaginibacter dorajii]MCS3732944.1 hypothetical protein [Mucilaginibacter dorajii]